MVSLDGLSAYSLISQSKLLHGSKNCDFELVCWKFWLVFDLESIYKSLKNSEFPAKLPIVVKEDNEKCLEVECSETKFSFNKEKLAENCAKSKEMNIFKEVTNHIFNGFSSSLRNIAKPSFISLKKKEDHHLEEELKVEKEKLDKMEQSLETLRFYLKVGLALMILMGVVVLVIAKKNII